MPQRKPILAVLLLFIGVELWLNVDSRLVRPMSSLLLYAVVIGAAFVPPVRRGIARASAVFDRRNGPRTTVAFFAIVAASAIGLTVYARSGLRVLEPVLHDEYSYRIQIQMLARGHLWMPPHPLADAFDSFYLITDRAYASQYFPGAAAMFVPCVWLGLPVWAGAIGIASLACGTLWLLLRELFDSASALGGVVAMLAIPAFRFIALATLSQMPAMLLAMWVWFALLRWERARAAEAPTAPRWLALAGAAMGWLAITRPLEAVAFGIVEAAFAGWVLRGSPRPIWIRSIVTATLPLVPFLVLQLIINHGVTGHAFQTPFDYYLQRDMPGTELGFRAIDPALYPVSTLRQKQDFYETVVVPALRVHTIGHAFAQWAHERTRNVLGASLPESLLLIVVPLALTRVRDRRCWLILGSIPAWCGAYSLHPFDLWHYGTVLTPCVLTLVAVGCTAVAEVVCGGEEARPSLAMSLRLLVPLALGVAVLPGIRRDTQEQMIQHPLEHSIASSIALNVHEPRAIVLIRYDPSKPSAAPEEIVYNADVAWPDDARVIRANDLDIDRNAALYRYYAQRQPDRAVYRFDRADESMTRLGSVRDLASASSATGGPATTAPTR